MLCAPFAVHRASAKKRQTRPKYSPLQKLHATIFDPPPPRLTRPEIDPDVAEDVRRRETDEVSLWATDGREAVSSWEPGGAESVAIGGSSVCSDGLREPGGTPYPVEDVIGGRMA